jgi:hypothetical protein
MSVSGQLRYGFVEWGVGEGSILVTVSYPSLSVAWKDLTQLSFFTYLFLTAGL